MIDIPCEHCKDRNLCEKVIENCIVALSVGLPSLEDKPDEDGFTILEQKMNDEIIDENDFDIVWTQ